MRGVNTCLSAQLFPCSNLLSKKLLLHSNASFLWCQSQGAAVHTAAAEFMYQVGLQHTCIP